MLSHAVDQNSSLEFLCFVSASGAQLPVIVFLLLRVPLHPTRRCTTISKWHGPRREFASFCNLLAVPAFRLRSCLGFERLTQAPVGPPQIARAKLPTPGVALLGSRACSLKPAKPMLRPLIIACLEAVGGFRFCHSGLTSRRFAPLSPEAARPSERSAA